MASEQCGYFIIGTAGHVDHGKTELIKALTGIDTDRLPEEKRRGMSIDLGFAYFRLPDGRIVGIVDVPGHERFVHNMLAGAAGMDLVLMVVAADEGVMAQTVEHLNILQLLDVRDGIIVITKRDLVDEEWLQLVIEDVREHFKGTFLDGAPVVAVSSVTGNGLDELVKLIQQRAKDFKPKKEMERPFRLPIDRAFIKAGFGVIVTGTAFSGNVSVGQEVEISPIGIRARVRSMQVHRQSVERAFAGQRVAMNLTGIERESIERGYVVTEVGYIPPTNRIAVNVRLLPNVKKPLKDGSPVRLHIGTGEWVARIFLISGDELAPGENTFAELRTDEHLACVRYDRFVIRSYSPAETIGGGTIVEPYPPRYRRRSPRYLESCVRKSTGSYEDAAQMLLEENANGLSTRELSVLLHITKERTKELLDRLQERGSAIKLNDELYISPVSYKAAKDELLSLLRSHHEAHPLHMGMRKGVLFGQMSSVTDEATLELLLTRFQEEGDVTIERELVRLSSHSPSLSGQYLEIANEMLKLCADAGFSPPSLNELMQHFANERDSAMEVFHALLESGQLVLVEEFVFHPHVIERAKQLVGEHIERHGKITVAEFRDMAGITRKYATPILEHLDRIGFTQRLGDCRILRSKAAKEQQQMEGASK
ncbi:MAG: selenocysteine-specific translation elongation factor [Armatimonadetes bacterium]|nr:selenocysteine-specific translation elongation factor [Armatimonadota bacterium]MCX7778150.1 selenocysteine-specific translation elongation factor [Armatimonadota bacterium]